MSYISEIRAKVGTGMIFNPGVRAIILNEKEEVLLQHRTDMAHWCLPSGGVETRPGRSGVDSSSGRKRSVLQP